MLNQFKTVLLLGAMSGLMLGVGWLLGGQTGLLVGLIFSLGFNFVSYWYSDKMVLKMYNAKLAQGEYEYVRHMVEDIARKAGLPKPKAYIIDTPQANAFATGRNPSHAVVACTTGIISALSKEELRAVIGHEVAHIKHRDILIASVAAGIASVISYIGTMVQWMAMFGLGNRDDDNGSGMIQLIVLGFVTPLIAALIQFAISRSREFLADEEGARLTRPEDLATALEKIHASVNARPIKQSAATQATAHMFIANPFSGKAIMNMFSTHPPMEVRVKKLRAMRH